VKTIIVVLWLGLVVADAEARPKKAVRAPMSAGCQSLCDEIRSCAGEIGQEKQADLLCHLAKCETGNKCVSEIRSPSGKFRGAFQFSKQTWKSVCHPVFKKRNLKECLGTRGADDPCCATQCAAEIVATKANGGLRNWPHCGPIAREAASNR
jgi:hypothetical protein